MSTPILFKCNPNFKNVWYTLGLLMFLGVNLQCKSSEDKSTGQTHDTAMQQAAQIKMDTLKTETYNADKTMLLKVTEMRIESDPAAHFTYQVFKKGEEQPMKIGEFRGSAINWNDKMSLKLIPYVGMERKPVSENPDEVLAAGMPSGTVIIDLADDHENK